MKYTEKEINRQNKIIREFKEKGWNIKDIACVAECSEYLVKIRLEEMGLQKSEEGFESKFKREWEDITNKLKRYNLSNIMIVAAGKE